MHELAIASLPIRLGQFLKVANLAQDGLEAKLRILNGEVTVNGVRELRRGRQLVDGDRVGVNGVVYRVSGPPPVAEHRQAVRRARAD